MNVLDASSGSVATFRQNAHHLPSCRGTARRSTGRTRRPSRRAPSGTRRPCESPSARAKSPTTGTTRFCDFELAEDREARLRRQIAAEIARFVGRRHQLRVGRREANREAAVEEHAVDTCAGRPRSAADSGSRGASSRPFRRSPRGSARTASRRDSDRAERGRTDRDRRLGRPRPAGRGRENSIETKSARSLVSSKIALYISCSSRLPRRMSKMIAIAGRVAAMYVKFCSGPTPR